MANKKDTKKPVKHDEAKADKPTDDASGSEEFKLGYTFYYAFHYLLDQSLDLEEVNARIGDREIEGMVYCDVDKKAKPHSHFEKYAFFAKLDKELVKNKDFSKKEEDRVTMYLDGDKTAGDRPIAAGHMGFQVRCNRFGEITVLARFRTDSIRDVFDIDRDQAIKKDDRLAQAMREDLQTIIKVLCAGGEYRSGIRLKVVGVRGRSEKGESLAGISVSLALKFLKNLVAEGIVPRETIVLEASNSTLDDNDISAFPILLCNTKTPVWWNDPITYYPRILSLLFRFLYMDPGHIDHDITSNFTYTDEINNTLRLRNFCLHQRILVQLHDRSLIILYSPYESDSEESRAENYALRNLRIAFLQSFLRTHRRWHTLTVQNALLLDLTSKDDTEGQGRHKVHDGQDAEQAMINSFIGRLKRLSSVLGEPMTLRKHVSGIVAFRRKLGEMLEMETLEHSLRYRLGLLDKLFRLYREREYRRSTEALFGKDEG